MISAIVLLALSPPGTEPRSPLAASGGPLTEPSRGLWRSLLARRLHLVYVTTCRVIDACDRDIYTLSLLSQTYFYAKAQKTKGEGVYKIDYFHSGLLLPSPSARHFLQHLCTLICYELQDMSVV